MPRVIIGAESPPQPTEVLVQALAEELTATKGHPLPLIVERHVRGTRSRHIWVVWDRWGDFTEEERTEIIVLAYTRVEGVEAAENISIASGVRPQDAAVFGLLPFLVQPVRPHDLERTDYRSARRREAQNTILGETARELRYPTEAEARYAIERLRRLDPGTEWIIHEEGDEEE